MKKINFFASFIFLFMSLPFFADGFSVGAGGSSGGVDFSGSVQTFWGVGTPFGSGTAWSDSDTAGRFILGETSLSGKLDAYYGNSSALAEGSVSYDAVSNQMLFSLKELWLDYTSSFWGVRIGRQKTAWGKADGIDITNVICPPDFSSISSICENDSKLAVDAIRFSFTGDVFTADAYWIPFFTPASLPLDEGNILRKLIVPESIDFPVNALNQSLTVPLKIGQFEEPEKAIWNGEYGFKLSGYFSALDISLYGFYGWEDKPFFDYDVSFSTPTESVPYPLPEELNVSGGYKRMAMLGLDAAIPIGETVLRMETAFFPERNFQKSAEKIIEEKTSSLGSDIDFSEKHNEITALAGLDWMPDGWTFTAQYYCDYVSGEIDALERFYAFMHGVTLNVSKTLLQETLKLSISGLLGLNDFDSFISPSLNYSVSDQISLETGAFIFLPGPEKNGQYGKYKNLSTAFIKAKFSF